MPQTKKQKQSKALEKLQIEYNILMQIRVNNSYLLNGELHISTPSDREFNLEIEINNLERKLNPSKIQQFSEYVMNSIDLEDHTMDVVLGNQDKFCGNEQ